MNRRKKLIAGGIVALAVIGGGTGIAIATGLGDDEPLTGSTLEQATAAAVQHTGGTVIESEAGDGGAAYGVEVRLDDGRVVEVALDENFNVIGQESDDDGANEHEDEGAADDD